MTEHVHVWIPDIAPEYRCDCGDVGRRSRRTGEIRPLDRGPRALSEAARIAREADDGVRRLGERWPQRGTDTTPSVDALISGLRTTDR